jgi:ornithine cyclodeaminase/alanine dehydrogenase-like protein (mu-crystallin family)
MLYISDALVRELVSPQDVLAAVEEDFRRQADPESTVLGVPLAYATDDRRLGFRWRLKTAILRTIPVAGVRVTGYRIDSSGSGSGGEPESTRLIVLSDPRTTSPVAIVDEHWTFGLRTSAAVIVAAKHLARPDSRKVGIIGVGNVGTTSLILLNELFDIDEVRVTSRNRENREAFAARMGSELGLNVRACESYEEVCRDADILICGTPAKAPFVRFDWLKEGVFIGAMGHDELDHDIYARCDRFFVDYNPAVEHHPTHIQKAVDSGVMPPDAITGQIWQMITGRIPGRRDARERILVSTVGLTSQDISVAWQLYQRARELGRGIPLPL